MSLERAPESHKGENGKVLVIGGSKDFTGAPALSAKAALRTGCDLTRIYTSEYARNVVSGFSENFIVSAYPSGYLDERGLEEAMELLEWCDAAVIGPGLGDPEMESVRKIVSETEKPLVIDAEAIEPALESDLSEAVFTPHSGEAEVIKQDYGSIEDFVEKELVKLVVKGPVDRVYTREGVRENRTGDPAMTVGGTGDVLTGIIASLISQGMEVAEATRKGCELNGKAGELAAEEYGKGALPTDMVEKIPEAREKIG